jgi:hypothetical protein
MQSPHNSPFCVDGRITVPDAPGWRYRSIEPDGEDSLAVTVEGADGTRVTFSVPTFVSRGDELGEVARIVIRARERMDSAAGLGA